MSDLENVLDECLSIAQRLGEKHKWLSPEMQKDLAVTLFIQLSKEKNIQEIGSQRRR